MSISMLDVTPVEADFVKKLSNTNEGSFFAILDACDEPRVPTKAFELGDKAVSLYRGKAEWSQVTIAPYLVSVKEVEFKTASGMY